MEISLRAGLTVHDCPIRYLPILAQNSYGHMITSGSNYLDRPRESRFMQWSASAA